VVCFECCSWQPNQWEFGTEDSATMAASVVSTVADSPVVKAAGAVGPGGQLVGGDRKF